MNRKPKVVILCGGKGSRMEKETEYIPKPLVEIGGKPILWHIMKTYAHYGFDDFILCLGYKGCKIKKYFLNYERWVLVPEEYNDFEYIYITDIDILTIREEPSLLDMHYNQMTNNSLPYSTPMDIPSRGTRLGGLFFFNRKEYLDKTLPVMNGYKYLISHDKGVNYFWNKFLNKTDNQLALYKIVTESELAIPKEHSFTYHGLHLGHSRCRGRWEMLLGKNRPIAEGDHLEYYKKYNLLSKDPIFCEMLHNTIPMIQWEITIMDNAYNEVTKGDKGEI